MNINLNSITVRVLRPLAAINSINEVGDKTWEANPITKAMATVEIAAGHRMVYVLFSSCVSFGNDADLPLRIPQTDTRAPFIEAR